MSKDQLKIVYISPAWPLQKHANGIVTYIDSINHAMHGKADVSVIALSANSIATSDNIYLASDRKKGLFERIIAKVLRGGRESITAKLNYRFSRFVMGKNINFVLTKIAESPDIIEVEESFGLPKSLIASTSAKVITRIHGPWFIHGPIMKKTSDKNYATRIKDEGRGIEISHGITAPSYDVLSQVRKYYDLPLENAVVIPNAVPPVPESAQWQYDSNQQSILFVGRFDLHKGGDIAIDAFNLIAAHNKTVEFYFVGPDRGLTIDGEIFNINDYLAKFIINEDIRKRIHVIGQIDAATVQQYRSKSTITLVTSRYEVFSISMVEALSTGSPLIASRIGGIPEIIEDRFNGYLAEVGDYEIFAKIAINLLDNPEQLLRISENAIKDANLKYAPDTIATQTLNYYGKILNGGAGDVGLD